MSLGPRKITATPRRPMSPPPKNAPKAFKTPKKSIDNTPAGIFNFIYRCIMYVIGQLVYTNIRIKIGIYIGALLICSLMKDFNLISNRNYLAQKNNVFNMYFVKLGWGWTLAMCTPFVLMTSTVYTGFNVTKICRHLSRVAIATLIWYTFTSSFEYIDSRTGECLKRTISTKAECKSNKSEWLKGFDISGHVFILMHSLLHMLEEVKFFQKWDVVHKKLEAKLQCQESNSAEKTVVLAETSVYWYRLLTPILRVNFILMSCLILLWECMLLTTCLFFHEMMHKLIACFLAIICWFLTYKTWYPSNEFGLTPGMPGDGLF